MRIFYFKAADGNFGDDLNEWLWEALCPGAWDAESDVLFTGIGTILGRELPTARHVVVFGSGAGYGTHFGKPRDEWEIGALRGPLTAKIVGAEDEDVVADGALMLSLLPEFSPIASSSRSGIVYVPHHHAIEDKQNEASWLRATELAGVELLDPRRDCKAVIHRLRSASLVLAESMHAAIIADTLRVPWIPIVSSGDISTFKWLDWSISVDVPYEPVRIPSPNTVLYIEDKLRPFGDRNFFFEPTTQDAAIENLRQMIAARNTGKRRMRQKIVTGVPHLLTGPAPRALFKILDRQQTERTALALRRASEREGYLTANGRVEDKASDLMDRLMKITSKYC